MNFRKHIFNPFVWHAITAVVFVALWLAGLESDDPIAALTFLPCLLMAVLCSMGVFGKFIK